MKSVEMKISGTLSTLTHITYTGLNHIIIGRHLNVSVCVLRVYLRHSLDALLIYVCISTSFSYCEMLSNHFPPGKSIYRFVVVGSISIQTLSVRPLSVPNAPRSFCLRIFIHIVNFSLQFQRAKGLK